MESGITIYGENLKNSIDNIDSKELERGEEALRNRANPTLVDLELKNKLWDQIAIARDVSGKVAEYQIYRGICHKSYWNKLLKNPKKMAWMLSPLVKYEDKSRALLDKATERYMEIIDMDICVYRKVKNEEGSYEFIKTEEIDPKKAATLLSVIKNLEDRVRGSAIQKSISVSANEPKTKDSERVELNLENVENKIKELEHKLGGSNDSRKTDTSGFSDTPIEADYKQNA